MLIVDSATGLFRTDYSGRRAKAMTHDYELQVILQFCQEQHSYLVRVMRLVARHRKVPPVPFELFRGELAERQQVLDQA